MPTPWMILIQHDQKKTHPAHTMHMYTKVCNYQKKKMLLQNTLSPPSPPSRILLFSCFFVSPFLLAQIKLFNKKTIIFLVKFLFRCFLVLKSVPCSANWCKKNYIKRNIFRNREACDWTPWWMSRRDFCLVLLNWLEGVCRLLFGSFSSRLDRDTIFQRK